MADADSKVCRVCATLFPLSEFYPHQTGKDGHRNECKACFQAKRKAIRLTAKPPPKTEFACVVCGTIFHRSSASANGERHCSIECRFWSKVDKSGGEDACWPWVSKSVKTARCGLQYGDFRINNKKSAGAHRVAWELANGPIPDGLCVCHKCDNPLCCNPAHHFLGTRLDNVADMLQKGRGAVMSAEGRARLIASKLGKPRPQHVIDAVSRANRGRKHSDEEIAKRAASIKARVSRRTEEEKARISENLRAAWVLRRQRMQNELR